MGYLIQNPGGIKAMSIGKIWQHGQTIGDNELPPALRDALLAEGAITPIVDAPLPGSPPARPIQRQVKRRPPAIPPGGGGA